MRNDNRVCSTIFYVLMIICAGATMLCNKINKFDLANYFAGGVFLIFTVLICYIIYCFNNIMDVDIVKEEVHLDSIKDDVDRECIMQIYHDINKDSRRFCINYHNKMAEMNFAVLIAPGGFILFIISIFSIMNLYESTRLFIFCTVVFYVICVIILMFQSTNINVFLSVFIIITLYLILIFFGSILFGGMILPEGVSSEEMNEITKNCFMNGLYGFFNYPSEDNVSYFYLGQYLLGKLIEWFFLGAISGLLIKQLDNKVIYSIEEKQEENR